MAWRILVFAVLAICVIAGTETFLSRPGTGQSRPWALRAPAYGPASYAAALAESETRIANKRELATTFSGDWVREEALALAFLGRFRLTGDYADLAAASAAIARGRALADEPTGPILTEAELGLAAHRLKQIEAALAVFARSVAPDSSERAEAAALAGDVAFYRGDMVGARSKYAEAAAIEPAGIVLRTAIVDKAQGQFDGAIDSIRAWLDAQKRPSPYVVATAALQIGAVELARGNYAEARRRFEEADRVFPGYWLTEAHLAQADAIAGDGERAIERMRLVAEKSGSAEAMDALAMLLRTFGQPQESRQWAGKASEAWTRRLATMPEAAYGHAVEHELVFGDPARALDLARRDIANRPYGQSRIVLASALLLNGQTAAALDQLRRAEASGWRSAPLYALRAELLALTGDGRGAEAARAAAEAINPRIFDPETALVWFSHG